MDSGLSLALSIIIGSIFVLTIMSAQENLHDLKIRNQLETIIQEKADFVNNVLSTDFERIGSKLPLDEITGVYLINGDTTSISFLTDTTRHSDPAGQIDTIKYMLGPVSELSHTDNPNDRILYRQVNDGPKMGISENITHLRFKFLKQDLTEANPAQMNQVKAIEVKAIIQTGYAYGTFWNPTTRQQEPRYYQSEISTLVCPNNLSWY
ncbi:MAG: hypothetical protein ACLFQM_11330 [Fidelibacterota bacterium]